MSIDLRKHATVPEEVLRDLDAAFGRYYSDPPASYYAQAGKAADHYNPCEQPFHCDLLSRIRPGMTLLEAGCGTAHLCPHVTARGGEYTGMDHSAALLAENAARHPRAQFVKVGAGIDAQFDVVASLYTLEHIVNPQAYLASLLRYAKPGGIVAVICPEFIDSAGYPPSLYYGSTPARLGEKLRRLSLIDAAFHIKDLKYSARRWKQRAIASPPGAFWINLRPRVLHGASYATDGDAVHLTRARDIVWWFEQQGAKIVTTSATMPDAPAQVLEFNCYTLAKKA